MATNVLLKSTDDAHQNDSNTESDTAVREMIGDLAFKALSQSGCGAVITDNTGKICFINSQICEITGYQPEELLGKNPKIFQSGSTKKETYLALWNSISSGRPWRGVLQNKKKNGELYWEDITISPIVSEEGEITHFYAIIEDITSEKMFETLQEQLTEEAYQVQKHESLNALSMGLAHDLNNVLTCVITGCDFLAQSAHDSSRVLDLTRIIRDAGTKGANIVRQLLEFSYHTLPTSAILSIRELTKRNLSYYDEMIGHELLLTWEPERDACFTKGNASLIHQALLHLLVNAKEASSSQGCIALASGRVPQLSAGSGEILFNCGFPGGPAVFIEVTDDGEGMDKETLRKMFDPFFTTKSGHRGLGLASVYGIMQGHRGAIGAKSSRKGGTTIRLYFPECRRIETEKSEKGELTKK